MQIICFVGSLLSKYVGLTDEENFEVENRPYDRDEKLLMSFSKICIPEKWRSYGDLPAHTFSHYNIEFSLRCQRVITIKNS